MSSNSNSVKKFNRLIAAHSFTISLFCILFVIGFTLYGYSLQNDFVGDDHAQVESNQLIRSLQNIPFLFFTSSFDNGGNASGIYYKPVMSSVFAFIHAFFGMNSVAFHIFSLIFHILNSFLVYLLFCKFFTNKTSAVLSIIFLIHPINSQVVLYVSALQDSLFFFFGLVAILLIHGTRASRKRILLSHLLLLLSLLSKESGVLFFLTFIVWEFALFRRISKVSILCKVLLMTIYMGLRFVSVGLIPSGHQIVPIMTLGLFERLLHIPAIIAFYVQTFIFPVNLAYSWNWTITNLDVFNFWIPLCIILGVVIYTFFMLRKKQKAKWFSLMVFFSIWIAFGLGLHLQIYPLDATVAERWFYFPIVGFLAILGLVWETSISKLIKAFELNIKPYSYGIVAVIGCLLFCLSFRTVLRALDWQDDFTLSSRDIQTSKDNFVIENSYAVSLIQKKDLRKAKVHAERSVKLFPQVNNLTTLAEIYASEGDFDRAKTTYQQAIAKGEYYVTYQNLAALMLAKDEPVAAEDFIITAVNRYPFNPKLWLYLAVVEYKLKRIPEAKAAIEQAYKLEKSDQILFVQDKLNTGEDFNVNISF